MTDQVAQIKSLIHAGKSFREIAGALNTTRNAIAGICYRNGIKSKRQTTMPKKAVKLPEPKRIYTNSLLYARLDQCRNIHGEARNAQICGLPVLKGSSWCADCAEKIYFRKKES